jgi:hypothetical protein
MYAPVLRLVLNWCCAQEPESSCVMLHEICSCMQVREPAGNIMVAGRNDLDGEDYDDVIPGDPVKGVGLLGLTAQHCHALASSLRLPLQATAAPSQPVDAVR